MPIYLNEGVRTWFLIFKAILLTLESHENYQIQGFKNEFDFLLFIGNICDSLYQKKPEEFIQVRKYIITGFSGTT